MKALKYFVQGLSIIGVLFLSGCQPENISSVQTVDATSSLNNSPIQTIGVNVNGQFDLMKPENLERTETTWVRGFIDIFQLYPEVSNLNTDPRMKEYLKLKDKGYKTILNIKWDFSNKSFPEPGSQEIKDYKKYLRKFLNKVWKQTDIIVIGNEPFIESKKEERDARLVDFYKEIANEVNDFTKGQGNGVGNGKGIRKVPIYIGAFNNLYLNDWRTPAVEDLLEFANDTPWISGIDLHIHHSRINQVNQAMDYVNNKIRENQKILITEYSLMKHWRFKIEETIPRSFADKYNRDRNEQNFQYIDYALKNKVSHQEWVDFLKESYWFENRTRYLWNSYQRMKGYDKFHVGTYALRQSFPYNSDFTSTTDPWILNGLFANRTVTLDNEGLEQFNYAWIDDFKAIQNEQKRRAKSMSGITGLKDTSRLIKSDGKTFCYATGGGIKMIWTSSLESGEWNSGPDVFPERPEWWSEYSPINIAWAPDIVFDENTSEYRMYYCTSKLGSSTSAIGLATNKTLNPENPEYEWKDKGIVISSEEGVDEFNALDPCPVQRPDGEWFLSLGSHFGGIKLIKLNEEGKWHQEDTQISDLARKNTNFRSAIEASAVYPGKKDGEDGFWLFVNWGTGNSIENGEDATYEVKMGWSKDIRGPYLDKEGNNMNNGGGTVFLSNEQTFDWDGSTRIARGHVGIIKDEKLDGTYPDWVSYSYWLKNPPERNGIRMGIQRLTEDEDGWPEAGELLRYGSN